LAASEFGQLPTSRTLPCARDRACAGDSDSAFCSHVERCRWLERHSHVTRRLLVGVAVSASLIAMSSCRPSTQGATLRCSGFQPRYIGSGLTVSLPPTATPTTYAATADLGNIQAAAGVEFKVNDVLVSIGRNLGHDNRPERNFAKRLDGDVVVWVKASNVDLRKCLLDSSTYSADRDQQDAS
jgi:hypothetical protein